MRAIALALFFLPLLLSAQTLVHSWPGVDQDPCTDWLSCENGCSACNTPVSSDPSLMGTAAAWLGLHTCPHAKGNGDNVVEVTGWSTDPDQSMVIISLIAFAPLQVDSIIIDHQGLEEGCERLQLRWGINTALPVEVVKDEPVDLEPQQTVITEAGCIMAAEGAVYGTAQLILQAYAGGDGWWLDQVRVVTSPCLSTGIGALSPTNLLDTRPVMDLLGRPVRIAAPQGVYLNARHQRVVVLP